MLEDVRDPGGVAGGRRKEDGEAVVVVRALDMDVPRAGALMLELQVRAFEALERLTADDRVAADSSDRAGFRFGHVNA